MHRRGVIRPIGSEGNYRRGVSYLIDKIAYLFTGDHSHPVA